MPWGEKSTISSWEGALRRKILLSPPERVPKGENFYFLLLRGCPEANLLLLLRGCHTANTTSWEGALRRILLKRGCPEAITTSYEGALRRILPLERVFQEKITSHANSRIHVQPTQPTLHFPINSILYTLSSSCSFPCVINKTTFNLSLFSFDQAKSTIINSQPWVMSVSHYSRRRELIFRHESEMPPLQAAK